MLLWHAIFSLFGATIIKHLIVFQGCSKREFTKAWSINGWMVVLIPGIGMSHMDGTCTCLWSRKQEKDLTRVTQFDKTKQNIKQHMCKVFLWNKTYGSGRTCLSLRNLPFQLFENKRLQISSITRTNLYNFSYHIYTHNNFDLDQAYATHGTFRFIGKAFT